tara:strand:- start:37 stop:303 length:267 start_codon:yes stop_codon:yes gene_type:complete
MMSNDDGSNDDDKIIDITEYVKRDSEYIEDEVDEFVTKFVSIVNQNIIEKQHQQARQSFFSFMINFLLFTQIGIVIVLCLIIVKLYAQ